MVLLLFVWVFLFGFFLFKPVVLLLLNKIHHSCFGRGCAILKTLILAISFLLSYFEVLVILDFWTVTFGNNMCSWV